MKEQTPNHPTMPVNTLDQALQLAKVVSRDLTANEGKTRRNYQVFAALTHSDLEALAALLIWKARAAAIKARSTRR